MFTQQTSSIQESTLATKQFQSATYKLFLQYLQLKAEHGLGRGSHLMTQVNVEANKKGIKVKLQNMYKVMGLKRLPLFRRFKMNMYVGPEGRPWEFSSFLAPSRHPGVQIETPFRSQQLIKLVNGIIDNQVDTEQLRMCGLLSEFFPLDTREKLQDQEGGPSDLMLDWSIPDDAVHVSSQVRSFFKTLFRSPSMFEIRDYYGEHIALYFALMQHFTKWLRIPSVVGLLAFFIQWFYPESSEPVRICFDLSYALILSLWGSLVLKEWKQKEVVLTTSWGQKKY